MVMIWRLNTEWKFEKFDCQGLQVVMMKLIVVLGDDPQDEDWMEPKLRFCYKILVRDSLQYTSEVGRNPLCNFLCDCLQVLFGFGCPPMHCVT